MNVPEVASDQMPRVWAAVIEQTGALVIAGVQFVVMQHLYSTYMVDRPDESWLRKAWQRYMKWQRYRSAKRWVNGQNQWSTGEKEVELIGS